VRAFLPGKSPQTRREVYYTGVHSRNWIVEKHHTRSGRRGLQMKHEDTQQSVETSTKIFKWLSLLEVEKARLDQLHSSSKQLLVVRFKPARCGRSTNHFANNTCHLWKHHRRKQGSSFPPPCRVPPTLCSVRQERPLRPSTQMSPSERALQQTQTKAPRLVSTQFQVLLCIGS
jgi:hypothetical protein